jgi:hypothetical protein
MQKDRQNRVQFFTRRYGTEDSLPKDLSVTNFADELKYDTYENSSVSDLNVECDEDLLTMRSLMETSREFTKALRGQVR